MTVQDLIDELKLLPRDYIVVINYQELSNITVEDAFYVLGRDQQTGYSIGPAVVLE